MRYGLQVFAYIDLIVLLRNELGSTSYTPTQGLYSKNWKAAMKCTPLSDHLSYNHRKLRSGSFLVAEIRNAVQDLFCIPSTIAD